MTWPGEGLLIKLWETLAEKGVGGLLRPWQIKREGKAQIEVRRLELVALADAEREADEIRAGRLDVSHSRYALALPPPIQSGERQRIEPTLEPRPAIEVSIAAAIGDGLRREVNVAKAITHAEEELKNDPQAPPERTIDPDWLFRWRDSAGSVSSEELQSLWGRLLAGEVKSPGSFSLRTLELLRNLSAQEAGRIAILAKFVIGDIIVRDHKDIFDAEQLTFRLLLDMQDLGVISGVESLGLTRTFNSVDQSTFITPLCSNGRVLLVKDSDPKKELKISVYSLTAVGKQLLRLGKFPPHEGYLRAVGEHVKTKGFTVTLGDYVQVTEEQIQISNEVSL